MTAVVGATVGERQRYGYVGRIAEPRPAVQEHSHGTSAGMARVYITRKTTKQS